MAGNPYHDAKGLFTTGPGGLSPHMKARLERSFGSRKDHSVASFKPTVGLVKQLSEHELARLRSKFGKSIKGG